MMPPMIAPLLLPPRTRPTMAPAAVPPATFATSVASVPLPCSWVFTPEIVATIGRSLPFTSTPTASSVRVPVVSLLLSEGLIAVTLRTTFEPFGTTTRPVASLMSAPTVAVTSSPGLLVLEVISASVAAVIEVPAASVGGAAGAGAGAGEAAGAGAGAGWGFRFGGAGLGAAGLGDAAG